MKKKLYIILKSMFFFELKTNVNEDSNWIIWLECDKRFLKAVGPRHIKP